MRSLKFEEVEKSYKAVKAVDRVSFEVVPGEIFGLLGPNGAGKTTLLRMLMDIIRADAGRILLDERPAREADTDRIGYLPEERGLYRKARVLEVLVYFVMLKGLTRGDAKKRARTALEEVGLGETAGKKLEELSKGMQQKVQIVATLLHDPALVVLDEPFSGLDPVNVRMVKERLETLKGEGKLIILSTHQMAQVEQLCDRIAMINRGRRVLYGKLREIRRESSGSSLLVRGAGAWGTFDSVERVAPVSEGQRVWLLSGKTPGDFLAEALSRGSPPEAYQEFEEPLEEIFVRVVEAG